MHMMARTALYFVLTFALAALAVQGLDLYWRAPLLAQTGADSSTTIPPQPVVPAQPVQTESAPAATAPIAPSPAPAAPAPAITAPAAPAVAPIVDAPKTQTPAPTAIVPSDTPAIANPPMPPVRTEHAGKDKNDKAGPDPAYDLFGAKKLPSIGHAAAIGYYPGGCLAGGVALPVDGPNWQVMRLSRNRNWGHPSLIQFVEKFAGRAAKATGWNGILVGDLAQPRGGPTRTGHKSHQTGLDVDIWFLPMPNHKLTRQEREDLSANNLVADDWKHINPKVWTPQHIAFIKTAAISPGVERVLVNAAIKKELCRVVGPKADWLRKVRPWYGHHDHIHVRLSCPADSPGCKAQPPVPEDEGCGKALDFWFSDRVLKPVRKFKPKKPMMLADLPPACKTVLAAPSK